MDWPGHVFCRIHVDDIAAGVIASFAGPPGTYNLADDEPVHRNRIIEWGCALLGAPLPPLQSLDDAGLSPAARAFYSENRRVANGKAKRLLGWTPRRSEEHTSELQSLMRISYAVFCLKKKQHETIQSNK